MASKYFLNWVIVPSNHFRNSSVFRNIAPVTQQPTPTTRHRRVQNGATKKKEGKINYKQLNTLPPYCTALGATPALRGKCRPIDYILTHPWHQNNDSVVSGNWSVAGPGSIIWRNISWFASQRRRQTADLQLCHCCLDVPAVSEPYRHCCLAYL